MFGFSGKRIGRRKLLLSVLPAAGAVALFFFLTGSFFLSRAAVPLIGRACGVELTAGQVDWRPWSGALTVRHFRLARKNGEPWLRIRRIRGIWPLRRMLAGEFSVSRVEASGVRLKLRCEGDGRRDRAEAPAAADPPAGPVRIDLRDVMVEESEIELEWTAGNRLRHARLTEVSCDIGRLANGRPSSAMLHGNLELRGEPALEAAGMVSLALHSQWSEMLTPERLDLRMQWEPTAGRIDGQALSPETLTVSLAAAFGPDETRLEALKLEQSRLGTRSSVLDLSGVFDRRERTAELRIRQAELAAGLIRQAGKLAFGIDPGGMRLAGSGSVRYAGGVVSSRGMWRLEREPGPAVFDGETLELPGFDFRAEQDFSYDPKRNQLEVRKLQLELTGSDRSALTLRLRHPTQLSVDTAATARPPELALSARDFRLELLRFAMPGRRMPVAGRLSGSAQIRFADDFSETKMTGGFRFSELAVRPGAPTPETVWRGFGGTLDFAAVLRGGPEIECSTLQLSLERDGAPFGRLTAAGRHRVAAGRGAVELKLLDWNASVLELLPPAVADRLRPGTAMLAPWTGGGELEADWTPELVSLDRAAVHWSGHGGAQWSAELDPQRFRRPDWTPERNWRVRSAWRLPAAAVAACWPGAPVRVDGGDWSGTLRADGGRDGRSLNLDGSWLLGGAALRWAGGGVKELTLQHDFSAYLPGTGRWQLNNGVFYGRIGGRPAFRLELSGSREPADGRWEATAALRYLNEALTEICWPGMFSELSLTGELRGSGGGDGRQWQAGGVLTLDRLKRPGGVSALSGQCGFELRRNPQGLALENGRLLLNCDADRAADLELSAMLPSDPSPFRLRVAGSDVALPELLAVWLPDGAPAPAPAAAGERRMLDFGTRPIDLTLKLERGRWNALRWGLDGNWQLCGRRLDTADARLTLDGSPVRFSLHLIDSPEGMAASSVGRLERPLELAGTVRSVLPQSAGTGRLQTLDWNLFTRRLGTAAWAAGLNGTVRASFADLVLPNREMHAPLPRLLLLPVEAVLRISALVPSSIQLDQAWRNLRETVLDPDSPLAELRFDRGVSDWEFRSGTAETRDVRFAGPLVRELSFRGRCELAGARRLELVSGVKVGGIAAELPVGGTLDEPRISRRDLLLALTGGQLGELFDRLSRSVQGVIPGVSDEAPGREEVPVLTPLRRFFRKLFGGGES